FFAEPIIAIQSASEPAISSHWLSLGGTVAAALVGGDDKGGFVSRIADTAQRCALFSPRFLPSLAPSPLSSTTKSAERPPSFALRRQGDRAPTEMLIKKTSKFEPLVLCRG